MTEKTALMALRAVRFGLGALGWFAPKKTTALMLLPVTGEPLTSTSCGSSRCVTPSWEST